MITVTIQKFPMTNLTFVDLQILYLGIRNRGRFDENDIQNSDLKNLGVGKILDQLASLKDRNLIEMNKDGSFLVTDTAKHILWDDKIPIWVRILRILEIKSFDIKKISSFLTLSQNQIYSEMEELRKRHLVLMSPLRNGAEILKMYEILPEGIEQISKIQSQGFDKPLEAGKSQIEIESIIDETIEEIKGIQEIPNLRKEKLISNLFKVKEKLKN